MFSSFWNWVNHCSKWSPPVMGLNCFHGRVSCDGQTDEDAEEGMTMITWQEEACDGEEEPREAPAASYESAIIGEAHGLISDMLADSALPPHVISGLRAVSNLLKPPENHGPSHKPKISPLVSLTEATNYGSDSVHLPYTGERPMSLPKRLRRSLPPSLIRRMSTSTWTTTTSATGMPTLEPEPCRTRSSSFRHSRESSPGSSPPGSRSNSPSPSSPTTISLTIPKSRSFSVTTISTSYTTTSPCTTAPKRDRKPGLYVPTNGQFTSPQDISPAYQSPTKDGQLMSKSEPEMKDNICGKLSAREPHSELLSKRFNITSDYESSDSPSSSDHSDNVTGVEDPLSRSLQSKLQPAGYHQDSITEREDEAALTDEDAEPLTQTNQSTSSSGQSEVKSRKENVPGEKRTESTHSKDTDDRRSRLPFNLEENNKIDLLETKKLYLWDYPIFELSSLTKDTILSRVMHKLFVDTGLFDTFRIPVPEFLQFFHALELGYRDKPYHNRIHATDVLHGTYYLTTQPIPGFQFVNPEDDVFPKHVSDADGCDRPKKACRPNFNTADDTYGILGGNFPPLELMALYTAAAMHDYDHPGRTNAFLVATHAPLAVLYNDRSVLENHHVASAWRLFMAHSRFNWLVHLDKTEFKRFRFLVVEAILATDLKRHFEILAEFNAKVNDEEATGIDWTSEADRLMVANMVIKMADINGPCKKRDLHFSWTERISEEFYEQGDEEASLGLAISPYMDRKHPQLAKLQESFINHLVAPLCNAMGAASLLPGTWAEQSSDSEETDGEKTASSTETDESGSDMDDNEEKGSDKKIHCLLTKNLKDNHDMWVQVLKYEASQKGPETTIADLREFRLSLGDKEMETIKEEDTPPLSAASTKDDSPQSLIPPTPCDTTHKDSDCTKPSSNSTHVMFSDSKISQSEASTAELLAAKPADIQSNACSHFEQTSDSTEV